MPPLKRNENMVSLSRDHHAGLLFCWKIRQGLKYNVDPVRLQRYTAYFWQTHLKPHFSEEETWLYKPLQNFICEQAQQEHAQIEALINKINATVMKDVPLYASLATLVDNHIRFEERIVFPHLENILPPERLAEIGRQLKLNADLHSADNYTDQFWLFT